MNPYQLYLNYLRICQSLVHNFLDQPRLENEFEPNYTHLCTIVHTYLIYSFIVFKFLHIPKFILPLCQNSHASVGIQTRVLQLRFIASQFNSCQYLAFHMHVTLQVPKSIHRALLCWCACVLYRYVLIRFESRVFVLKFLPPSSQYTGGCKTWCSYRYKQWRSRKL